MRLYKHLTGSSVKVVTYEGRGMHTKNMELSQVRNPGEMRRDTQNEERSIGKWSRHSI